MASANDEATDPKILVFSSNVISDLGIDMAGSAHMSYSTMVQVIPLPCSSGVKPAWIVHALEEGFDGVFIAACGGDCMYVPDCTARTSAVVNKAQDMLRERHISPKRLKMAGICSVCADNFVDHMDKFQEELKRHDSRE
ncbi:MAG: hydrogenase iron-sulfur subunit [candidate division Zixibacteria bacterium]|nr:hydrogenase iron-sulfur subunit [candidate division Zixibacteria bacterium]